MKTILFFFAFICSLSVFAEVTIGTNNNLSQEDQKAVKYAVKRAANFYSWYLTFLTARDERPLKHVVIDQNTTIMFRKKVAENTSANDLILASNDLDTNCSIVITPLKIENGRILLKADVSGKYSYNFQIEMIKQRDCWCVDQVSENADLH